MCVTEEENLGHITTSGWFMRGKKKNQRGQEVKGRKEKGVWKKFGGGIGDDCTSLVTVLVFIFNFCSVFSEVSLVVQSVQFFSDNSIHFC